MRELLSSSDEHASNDGAQKPKHDMALRGITVLDMSRLLPGPLATQFLADMGADVIKVEDTAGGGASSCHTLCTCGCEFMTLFCIVLFGLVLT